MGKLTHQRQLSCARQFRPIVRRRPLERRTTARSKGVARPPSAQGPLALGICQPYRALLHLTARTGAQRPSLNDRAHELAALAGEAYRRLWGALSHDMEWVSQPLCKPTLLRDTPPCLPLRKTGHRQRDCSMWKSADRRRLLWNAIGQAAT